MKVLQEVQKSFESLGLSPKSQRFNYKMLRTFVVALAGTISQWMFFFFEVDSSQEYLESVYIMICCGVAIISYTNIVFIKDELFALLDKIDQIINERMPFLFKIFPFEINISNKTWE